MEAATLENCECINDTAFNLLAKICAPNLPAKICAPNLPAEISVPNLPTEISVPNLPAKIAVPNLAAKIAVPNWPVEISVPNRPAEISVPNLPAKIAVPNLPAKIAVPNRPVEISVPNRPAEISVPNLPAEISVPNLPGEDCVSNLNSNSNNESIDIFLHHPLHSHGCSQPPILCDRTSKPAYMPPDASSGTGPIPVMLLKNKRNNDNDEPYIEVTSSENCTLQSKMPISTKTSTSLSRINQSCDSVAALPALQSLEAWHAVNTATMSSSVYHALTRISALPFPLLSSALPPPPSSDNRYAYCAYCRVPLLKPYACVERIPLYFFCTACYKKILRKEPMSRYATPTSFVQQGKKRGSNYDHLIANLKTKNNDQNVFIQPQSSAFSAACQAVVSVLSENNGINTRDEDTMTLNVSQHKRDHVNIAELTTKNHVNIAELTTNNQTVCNQNLIASSGTCPFAASLNTEINTENLENMIFTGQRRKHVKIESAFPVDQYTGVSAVHQTADVCGEVKSVKEEPPDMYTIQYVKTVVPSSDVVTPQAKDTDPVRKKEKKQKVEYPCQECAQIFDQRIQLIRHKFIHSDKFYCTQCGKRFASSGRLVRHAKIHAKPIVHDKKQTGVNIDSSSDCTTNEYASKNTVKNVNENAPLCVWCKKPGPVCGEEECRQRRRTCPTCGLRFPTLRRLADHTQNIHVKQQDYRTNLVNINASRINNNELLSTLLDGDDIVSDSVFNVNDFLNDSMVKIE